VSLVDDLAPAVQRVVFLLRFFRDLLVVTVAVGYHCLEPAQKQKINRE
jgi:hypothetical protein